MLCKNLSFSDYIPVSDTGDEKSYRNLYYNYTLIDRINTKTVKIDKFVFDLMESMKIKSERIIKINSSFQGVSEIQEALNRAFKILIYDQIIPEINIS